MSSCFGPQKTSATPTPPARVPTDSETPMGPARRLKLHRGCLQSLRCCWLDTPADLASLVTLCTNDNDPAVLYSNKISKLSKLEMGKLIILFFPGYGAGNRSQGAVNASFKISPVPTCRVYSAYIYPTCRVDIRVYLPY